MTENIATTRLKGSGVDIIKKKIILAPPDKDAIIKITDRKDEIIIESAEIVKNGDYAIVKGYLNKSITYNTANKEQLKKLIVNQENQAVNYRSLTPKLELVAADGVVRHTTTWIPFEILVFVKGASEDDKVIIENKSIKSLCDNDEEVEDKFITGILVQDIINIDITVIKTGG
ncbi:MAG: hypothetical protein E7C86_01590 [Paeniclostridium sordellii]|uniref:SipL SPOCS domain-containing protein n=1 Tax=Paeniclostridium hominis TaxID=2764329 RepID=A0ABR7JZQ7_9FIRM|nr:MULTISPECIES: hypothetical protein [Paeniclostridium]MBC6002338.1 hypothetical protein [Paeniclostridium hominis]MDU2591297.1 hypothetical protein [Paeniclostridium sordellii]